MQDIKNLILSRIADILELESLDQAHQQNEALRLSTIRRLRSVEEQRNARQSYLVVSLNNHKFESNFLFDDILTSVHQICSAYDPTLMIEQSGNAKIQLYKIIRNFFINTEFRDKIPYLKTIFLKLKQESFPSLILSWLCEWSKKKYWQIVNMQMKPLNTQNTEQNETSIKYYRSLTESIEESTQKSTERSNLNRPNIPKLPQFRDLQTEASVLRKCQQGKNASEGSHNNPKLLTIYNRSTLYAYMSEELAEYYKMIGILDVDKNFTRSIRKRKLKQHLQNPHNLKKAVETLIQCSANKQIKLAIKQYETCWNSTHEQKRKQNKTQIKKSNKRAMSDYFSGIQHRRPTLTQGVRSHESGRKEAKVNESTAESIDNQQILVNMRYQIKLHLMGRINKKYHLESERVKLPSLSRSTERQDKPIQDKNQPNVIRFPTQQRVEVQQNDTDSQKNPPNFNFAQRQTIRGIIFRNFISNKDNANMKQTHQHSSSGRQRKQIAYLNRQINKKSTNWDQSKRVDPGDIKSLRKKTNALLRNFNTIQRY